MTLFYDFNGRRHEIKRDEVNDILSSGMPHRAQDAVIGQYNPEDEISALSFGVLVMRLCVERGIVEAGRC